MIGTLQRVCDEQTLKAFEEQDFNTIIENNMKLVYMVVKKYFCNNSEYIDLGMIGLINGVKSFDINKGYKLSTYLTTCISNEITMFYRSNSKKAPKAMSLDDMMVNRNGDQIPFIETIADNQLTPEQTIIKSETESELARCLKKLNPRQQYVINHMHELNGCVKKTQKQLAIELHTEQSHISDTYRRSLKKLKKMMEGDVDNGRL